MEVIENSVWVYERLKEQRFFHENGRFYKCYSSVDDDLIALSLMEKYKAKLTEDFYSFIHRIHKYQDEVIGLESRYHEGHQTLLNVLKYNDLNLVNKRKIFLEVVQVLEELKNIGVYYWDVHSENILIKDHIKLIDLSAAKSKKEEQNFSLNNNRLLNLLLEMYLFYDDIGYRIDFVNILLRIPGVAKYFSSVHFNWIKNINDSIDALGSWKELITEFEDEEKINLIRNCLKERRY